MAIEFYNVKKRAKVTIDEDRVRKQSYQKTNKDGAVQERYAFKAIDDDGTNLTRFCSKADWDAVSAPIA